jgi:hypothetical protein
MNMKGQGALEYLMTYGWALLIIVVVGSALYSLGILNPATYTQSTCTGFQYFQFRDQKITSTTYDLEVLNGNRDIGINSLDVDGNLLTVVNTPAGTHSAGSSFLMTGTGAPTTKATGDSYSVTVTVSYNVTGGIQNNVDTSTCTGTVA